MMSAPRLFDGQTQIAQHTLPTMYDLPSESAEESGLLRADQERQLAEQERLRAEQEGQRADQEKQRADALAQRLRDLVLEP
jgi:hypothetical protein